MISIRAALFISGFLGALFALLGAFTSLNDFGAGMVVAAVSVIGWGVMDWIEEH